VPPPAEQMLIGNQIRDHGVDGPQMSVDKVKETLRQEMVAEFLKMNTGMMGTGMDTKESLRREIMTEVNGVLMGAGEDTKEYLREEMVAEIKAALKGVAREESKEIMNARDAFRRDPVSSVNIVIALPGQEMLLPGAGNTLEKR
jgi:uncharacterized Fe-S cluster-containing radical SAM superfamily protein